MRKGKGDPLFNGIDVELAMALYNTGHYTLKQIGYLQNVSGPGIYHALKKAGCTFIRTQRIESRPEVFIRRSQSRNGKPVSKTTIEAVKKANTRNYDGINKYGHTKVRNDGYIKAYAPLHPKATKDGFVMLHRIIYERHIGRYLTDDEVVHHINHNRSDNRIENLKLMTKKEHMSMHMHERYSKQRSDNCD